MPRLPPPPVKFPSIFVRPGWKSPILESGFLRFLDQVLALLELPEPPPAGEKCAYCQYRQHAREHGM